MRLALGFILAARLFSQGINTVQVASGISAPTDIQNAGDGSGRLFLVQQNGLIKILKNGAVLSTPFLDIRSKTRADGERGLWVLPSRRDMRRAAASISITPT